MERRKQDDPRRRLRFGSNQGPFSSSSLLSHILQVPLGPGRPQPRLPLRCGLETEQQETRPPPRPAPPRPAALGAGRRGLRRGRRPREPSLPGQENVLSTSFTDSAEQRGRPAPLEGALRSAGLDLLLHLPPCPPRCPRRGLLPSTLCPHRGDPEPRRAEG